jgi:siroheme synthase-like protein
VPGDYPVFLDLSERLAVVVGGGAVAGRKIRGLLEAGAGRVRVVAPEIDPTLPLTLERVAEPYRAEHLQGAGLVFAATNDPAINEAVSRDARQLGIWVNRVDRGEGGPKEQQSGGDFLTPAVLRRGPIRVAVSAGAPALSARIRDRIGEWIDPEWVALAAAMKELRPVILDAPVSSAERAAVFADLLSPEVLAIAGEEGTAGVRQWIAQRHPKLGLRERPRVEREEL